MKVNVWYNVGIEVDIPEEEIRAALAVDDHLEQGGALNQLAQKYSTDVKSLWDNNASTGEISGVYNSLDFDSDGRLVFANDNFEEVIWEG